MPRCGCQGKPALYSSGLSLRKSSNSRKGSNSLVSTKPKARRRCTPAPSMVGFDWMIFFTGRMDMMHLVDASGFRSVWSRGRGELVLVACGLERPRPPDQLIQHVFDAGLKVGDALQFLAILPHRHEVGALDIDTAADGCHLQFGRDQAQLLNRARAADRAVADKPGGLLDPLRIRIIERVLQHRRNSV